MQPGAHASGTAFHRSTWQASYGGTCDVGTCKYQNKIKANDLLVWSRTLPMNKDPEVLCRTCLLRRLGLE